MTNKFDPKELNATAMRIILNEIYPEATYGAIPVMEQRDAVEAYLAFDDGALAESPGALAALPTAFRRNSGVRRYRLVGRGM